MAVPLTTVAMASAGPGQDGIASGVNNAVSRIGPLIAVAVLGYWQAILFLPQLTSALELNQVPQEIKNHILDHWRMMAAMPIPVDWPDIWQMRIEAMIAEIYAMSVKSILVGCSVLSVFAGFIAFGYRRTDGQAGDD